jgi:hypothetical protein
VPPENVELGQECLPLTNASAYYSMTLRVLIVIAQKANFKIIHLAKSIEIVAKHFTFISMELTPSTFLITE